MQNLNQNIVLTSDTLIFAPPAEVPPCELLIAAPPSNTGARKTNLTDFTNALKNCGIIDIIQRSMGGSVVLLPHGVQIFHRHFDLLKHHYSNHGLQEYNYPMLVPTHFFSPIYDYLSLKNKLLHVGNDHDFAKGAPRGTLCPTGEEVIYPHWREKIKTKKDLPIELFRQTNYYRPVNGKHRGGLFRSMEAADVFEFHCCYANSNQERFSFFQKMLSGLTELFHLPVIWSDRPLATNNNKISKQTLGCDALLPVCKTIQISSIYDQRDLLSKIFNIHYKENNSKCYTNHITGFVSRRAVWSGLFSGLKKNGTFFLNPDLTPIQLHISIPAYHVSSKTEFVATIKKQMDEYNIRYQLKILEEKESIKKVIANNLKSSICLSLVIRKNEQQYKLSIINSLDEKEETLTMDNLDRMGVHISTQLNLLKERHKVIIRNYLKKSIQYVNNYADLNSSAGFIQAFPLAHTTKQVLQIESSFNGEVLGFIPSSQPRNCILTHEEVHTLALLSKRI